MRTAFSPPQRRAHDTSGVDWKSASCGRPVPTQSVRSLRQSATGHSWLCPESTGRSACATQRKTRLWRWVRGAAHPSRRGRFMHDKTCKKPNGPDKLSLTSSNFLQNGTRFDENVENEKL